MKPDSKRIGKHFVADLDDIFGKGMVDLFGRGELARIARAVESYATHSAPAECIRVAICTRLLDCGKSGNRAIWANLLAVLGPSKTRNVRTSIGRYGMPPSRPCSICLGVGVASDAVVLSRNNSTRVESGEMELHDAIESSCHDLKSIGGVMLSIRERARNFSGSQAQTYEVSFRLETLTVGDVGQSINQTIRLVLLYRASIPIFEANASFHATMSVDATPLLRAYSPCKSCNGTGLQ